MKLNIKVCVAQCSSSVLWHFSVHW